MSVFGFYILPCLKLTITENCRDVPDMRSDPESGRIWAIRYLVSGGIYPVKKMSLKKKFFLKFSIPALDSQLKYTDLNLKVVNFIRKKRQRCLVCTVIIDRKLSFYLFTIHYAAANQKTVALCDDC